MVLNNLHWGVGKKVNVDSHSLVENVVKTEREIEEKESNECDYEHSDDEINYFIHPPTYVLRKVIRGAELLCTFEI